MEEAYIYLSILSQQNCTVDIHSLASFLYEIENRVCSNNQNIVINQIIKFYVFYDNRLYEQLTSLESKNYN